MHLQENVLPLAHAAAYTVVSATVVAFGVRQYYKKSKEKPDFKILSGIFVAFVFLVTIIEIPTGFGSTEHPTGTPLMSIFMGPPVTAFLSVIVLLLELFFREGGITTLGANVLSLGVIGGLAGWSIFYILRKMKLNLLWAGFFAGFLGDLLVYVTTATELGIAKYQGNSFLFFLKAFVAFQIPIAIVEGIFTALVLNFMLKRRPEILKRFKIID